MRVLIVITALLSLVSANPIDSELSNLGISSDTLVARDVSSTEGRFFNQTSNLVTRGKCGSVWYQTKCYFYCPCGWYYYKDCHSRLCVDQDRVGCRGRCPKNANLACSTCDYK